jgi:GLPGLI family protein
MAGAIFANDGIATKGSGIETKDQQQQKVRQNNFTIMKLKTIFTIFSTVALLFTKSFAQESRIISDCTIVYDVSVEDPKVAASVLKATSGTTKVVYIKGGKSRSDLETPNFKQIMIYDSKNDSTVILRELGNNKYISYLDGNKRKEKNRKYEGIKFNKTSEKKTILGYECDKVIATLADGSNYDVYYTTSIVPSITGYEYQFKDIPGFVLEYEAEFEQGKTKVKFTASKINLVPVPVAKFDVPKTGYRVL